ncbi:MAG: endonuclease [Prevotellaceae bacterium]|jgi:endonuclease I|nr:endonuclease [Prevotellaceae bacterium]
MMKKILNIFVAMLVSFTLTAQAPVNYYDNAEGKSGAELKTALHNIIKNHTELSYSYLWTAFYTTDTKPDGKVWDMYSNTNYTFGSDQQGGGGSPGREGQMYNREHSFPKSWFRERTPMYTDLFHLYPADAYVNSRRSNYPYGNVGYVRYTTGNGSKLGNPNTSNFNESEYVFEPADEYKGDFARTYFYMATCYENQIAGWKGNNAATRDILDGNSYPAFKAWYADMLIEWHNADPVSEKEIDRNNEVYRLQGNRNPYIDHPEWVECVWKENCISQATVIISDIKYQPAIPDETSAVNVSSIVNIYGDDVIQTVNLYYGTSSSAMNSNTEMTLTNGRYAAQIPAYPKETTVFFQVRAITQKGVNKGSTVHNYRVVEAQPNLIISNLTHSPQNPDATDDVTVTSEIYAVKDEISSVTLYWSIHGNSTPFAVTMNRNENIFTAMIPHQPNETVIKYYIEAVTQGGIVKVSEMCNYVVCVNITPDDIIIENIIHSPLNPKINETITVSADVYCSVAKTVPLLRWYDSNNPDKSYTQVMNNTVGNNFSTRISAPDRVTSVCFQILAGICEVFNESALRCVDISESQVSISGNLLQLTEKAGIARIEIYNISGQCIFAKAYSGDLETSIDVSSFAGGNYIIRIRTVKGTFSTVKIVL